jgi:hypothetical protein
MGAVICLENKMKFEEVLPLMKEGKKARHARMKTGEYWTCGYARFEEMEKWPTLIKIFNNPFEPDRDIYSWGIERWAIMDDTWEIVE